MSYGHMVASRSRRRFFTILVIAYLAVVLFPVFWMLLMVFRPEDQMFVRPTAWLFTPTLDHFAYVIREGFHWNLINSLIIALVSTGLVVVIGTPAAYAFARFDLWRKDDLFLFVLATRMAPPVALVIPFFLIYAKIGLIDTYTGVIIAYLTFNLSFYVWVLRSFCKDMPVALEEAALAEGYSRLQVLWKVVLPLLRPGITATAVLSFMFAWNEFLFALQLGGRTAQTLPVAIPKLISSQGVRWGELAVVGLVALIPVLVAVFLLQRNIIRGLTMGAVKG